MEKRNRMENGRTVLEKISSFKEETSDETFLSEFLLIRGNWTSFNSIQLNAHGTATIIQQIQSVVLLVFEKSANWLQAQFRPLIK